MFPEAAVRLLTSPLGLMLLMVLVGLSAWTLSAVARRKPSRSPSFVRLLWGYGTVIVLSLSIGWVIDAIEQEAAAVARIFLPYASTLVMALLGVPALVVLRKIDRWSTPWCLAMGLLVGLALTVGYFAMGSSLRPWGLAEWASHLGVICGGVLLAMLAFCIGARVPWRRSAA
jgi:hypothetical protein